LVPGRSGRVSSPGRGAGAAARALVQIFAAARTKSRAGFPAERFHRKTQNHGLPDLAVDGENPAVVGVNTPVFFVYGLVAHHVGIRHLSTEDIELQIEILGVFHEASGTLLACLALGLAPDPDLVLPSVEDQLDPEGSHQVHVGLGQPKGLAREVEFEGAQAIREFSQIDVHVGSLGSGL
jgi:hypothetical protein